MNEAVIAVLEDLRTVLESINDKLDRLEQKLPSTAETPSSVEIKTSTRGVDISAKSYAGSDITPARTSAVDAYFAALEDVQQRLNGGGA